MKINEIKEVGFYREVNDIDRKIIYEVIENTDEDWLKEDPEATLLIDTWLYDYKDENDRVRYSVDSNLFSVYLDESDIDVVKIEDTKYKVFGVIGQFLIEDKPTYKEQLQRKEQECEELKEQLQTNQPTGICETCMANAILQNDKYRKALEEIENFTKKHCDYWCEHHKILDIINEAKGAIMSITEITDIKKLQSRLKSALDELKYIKKCCENAGVELAKHSFAYDYKEKNLVIQAMELNEKFERREKALDEIKSMCDKTCQVCEIFTKCDKEYSTCRNARIKDIISKIKDGNNERLSK